MNNCPCCSTPMLRHSRNSQIYWYCLDCKQEMPNLIDRLKQRTILTSLAGSPALSRRGASYGKARAKIQIPYIS